MFFDHFRSRLTREICQTDPLWIQIPEFPFGIFKNALFQKLIKPKFCLDNHTKLIENFTIFHFRRVNEIKLSSAIVIKKRVLFKIENTKSPCQETAKTQKGHKKYPLLIELYQDLLK